MPPSVMGTTVHGAVQRGDAGASHALVVIWVSIALQMFVFRSARGAEGGPETNDASKDEIRRQIQTGFSRVKSIRVTCRYSEGRKTEGLQGQFVLKTLAARDPLSFYAETAHGHDGLDWRDDPARARLYVTHEDVTTVFELNRARARRQCGPAELPPREITDDPFLLATGHWPATLRKAPTRGDRPICILEILAQPEVRIDRVRFPERNLSEVILIRNGESDLIWLDPMREYCVLRREFRSVKTNQPSVRFDLFDHAMIADIAWLPSRIERTEFIADLADRGSPDPDIIKAVKCDVVDVGVNCVGPEEFKYSEMPGTLEVGGKSRRWFQSSPGGLDHFDGLAKWLQKYDLAGKMSAGTMGVWFFVGRVGELLLSAALGALATSTILSLRGRRLSAAGRS